MFGESIAGYESNPVIDSDLTFLEEEPVVPNILYPGDKCCTFYAAKNFGRSSSTHCIGEHETEHIYLPDKHLKEEWIGSFECGKNVRYEIQNYRTPNIKYDIMTGAGHVRAVSVDSHFTGGRVTLVIMRTYDQWEQGSATVWGTANCQGPSAELAAYSTLDKAHSFTTAEAE
jgi:hypothetical protein